MSRFINSILLLAATIQLARGQVKTIDFSGTHPSDIKVDRMNNGEYFIVTTDKEKAVVTFYDENFTLRKQVEIKIEWGKAREAIYASDSNFLCIGFPKTPGTNYETDFCFYVLSNSGEVIANKTFSKIEIKSLIMSGNKILLISLDKKDNTLHYHLLDQVLNSITETLLPLQNKNSSEKVECAIVNGDGLLAYTFTTHQANVFIDSLEVIGFRTTDGVQAFNVKEEAGEKNYSFDYAGQGANQTFILGGEFSNRDLFGHLSNSGVFKFVVSAAGEKQSIITKSWIELFAQLKYKYTALYTSQFGLNNVGIDFFLQQKGGFLILCHLNFAKFALYTDSVLNPIHTIELRQNENDLNDFVYEEVLCTLKDKTPIALLFMADSKEGYPALFASTLNPNDPHFIESIPLNGRNGNPKMTWTNKVKNSTDQLFDLENCNPSLIPSDPLHLVLFDDDNKDVRGARLYIYSVR